MLPLCISISVCETSTSLEDLDALPCYSHPNLSTYGSARSCSESCRVCPVANLLTHGGTLLVLYPAYHQHSNVGRLRPSQRPSRVTLLLQYQALFKNASFSLSRRWALGRPSRFWPSPLPTRTPIPPCSLPGPPSRAGGASRQSPMVE